MEPISVADLAQLLSASLRQGGQRRGAQRIRLEQRAPLGITPSVSEITELGGFQGLLPQSVPEEAEVKFRVPHQFDHVGENHVDDDGRLSGSSWHSVTEGNIAHLDLDVALQVAEAEVDESMSRSVLSHDADFVIPGDDMRLTRVARDLTVFDKRNQPCCRDQPL